MKGGKQAGGPLDLLGGVLLLIGGPVRRESARGEIRADAAPGSGFSGGLESGSAADIFSRPTLDEARTGALL